jgi:restriction endonuclease S subunit
MKLRDLATLRTGLVLNRKKASLNDDNKIKYKQLNLKSITIDGAIDKNSLEEFIAKERLKQEYLSQIGDVIVRLSHPYTAVIIDETTKGLVVPSHFIIIKCEKSKIVPGYLWWLLNTQKMRKQISLSTGTSALGTIRPSFFSEIEIFPVPIEKQKALTEINILAHKEIELLTKLKEEKQKYYTLLTDEIQKEMRNK